MKKWNVILELKEIIQTVRNAVQSCRCSSDDFLQKQDKVFKAPTVLWSLKSPKTPKDEDW